MSNTDNSVINQAMNNNVIVEYKKYSLPSLIRTQELGLQGGFGEVENKLADIKLMLDEMVFIAEGDTSISAGLIGQIIVHVRSFNEIAKSLAEYKPLDSNSLQIRQSLIRNIEAWYNSIYLARDVNNSSIANTFLQTYNRIKAQTFSSDKDHQEIQGLKPQLEDSLRGANDLINILQTKTTSVTVQDYAMIFKNEAEKYSSFKLKPLRIGSSQIWLLISIVLVIGFIVFVLNLNNLIPIDFEQKGSVVTLELVTRILIVSFSIYLITFCFKQFNVQNHLFTLNRHRQNTLNSYELFIKSIDSSDGATRNALLMEVAKAIYEAGPSGYISSKDADTSPSIVEISKFIGQSKSN